MSRELRDFLKAIITLAIAQFLAYLVNNIPLVKDFNPILYSQYSLLFQTSFGLLIFLLIIATVYITRWGGPSKLTPIDNVKSTCDKVEKFLPLAEKVITENCPGSEGVKEIRPDLEKWIDNNKALLGELLVKKHRKLRRDTKRIAILKRGAPLVVNLTRCIITIIDWGNYLKNFDFLRFLSEDDYARMAKQAYTVGNSLSTEKELKIAFDLAYMLAQLFYDRSQSSSITDEIRKEKYRKETKTWIKNLKKTMEKLVPNSQVLAEQTNWINKLKKTMKKWVTKAKPQNPPQDLVNECEAKWLYMKGLKQRDFDYTEQKALDSFNQALEKAKYNNPHVHVVVCRASKYLGSVKRGEEKFDEAISYYEEALKSADCQAHNYENALNIESNPAVKAECYQQLGELKNAKNQYEDALRIFRDLLQYIKSHSEPPVPECDALEGIADSLNELMKEKQKQSIVIDINLIKEGYKYARDAYKDALKNALTDKQTKLTTLMIHFADRLSE